MNITIVESIGDCDNGNNSNIEDTVYYTALYCFIGHNFGREKKINFLLYYELNYKLCKSLKGNDQSVTKSNKMIPNSTFN